MCLVESAERVRVCVCVHVWHGGGKRCAGNRSESAERGDGKQRGASQKQEQEARIEAISKKKEERSKTQDEERSGAGSTDAKKREGWRRRRRRGSGNVWWG